MNISDFSRFEGFDWDKANVHKNWERHKVAFHECEEVLLRVPALFPDMEHSDQEPWFYAFGKTIAGRKLVVVFTMRKNKIRIISAREMSRKERNAYEKIQKDPEI